MDPAPLQRGPSLPVPGTECWSRSQAGAVGAAGGQAVCGALTGKAAGGCHPSVTPSPPQGVTVGAARVSPPDWEHRLVVLTAS